MWIKIEPLDVLLFRESKPFSAGENFRAAGQFPPTSLPLVGALRSRIMAHLGLDVLAYAAAARKGEHTDLFEQIGSPDRLYPLAATGPFLAYSEQNICWPWPLDLLAESEDHSGSMNNVTFLRPRRQALWPIESSLPYQGLKNPGAASGGTAMEAGTSYFLEGSSLKTYLTEGDMDGPFIAHISKKAVAATETRLGIALNDWRTAQRGKIYSAGFTRMKQDASIWLKLTDQREKGKERQLLPEEGFLALGGEARAASFTCFKEQDEANELPESLGEAYHLDLKDELADKLTGKKCFKLCLLTPAIFKQGWLPDKIDPRELVWEPASGVRVKLIAAAVGKPEDIGGWNLVHNQPRPLYRAAQAGSVYFFEAEEELNEETAKTLLQNIHFQSLMQPAANGNSFPGFCREAGFGLAAVGVWNYQQED